MVPLDEIKEMRTPIARWKHPLIERQGRPQL